jgi:hypothetical protein
VCRRKRDVQGVRVSGVGSRVHESVLRAFENVLKHLTSCILVFGGVSLCCIFRLGLAQIKYVRGPSYFNHLEREIVISGTFEDLERAMKEIVYRPDSQLNRCFTLPEADRSVTALSHYSLA